MTSTDLDALRGRVVMTSETVEAFTVTVVEVEATPAEGVDQAAADLAGIARTLSELDALADRGVDVRSGLRSRWLALRVDALRRFSRYALALLRHRRGALADGLDRLVDRTVEVLDALAVALSRLDLGRLVESTLRPSTTVTLGLWPAPPTAPPSRSELRHRWELYT